MISTRSLLLIMMLISCGDDDDKNQYYVHHHHHHLHYQHDILYYCCCHHYSSCCCCYYYCCCCCCCCCCCYYYYSYYYYYFCYYYCSIQVNGYHFEHSPNRSISNVNILLGRLISSTSFNAATHYNNDVRAARLIQCLLGKSSSYLRGLILALPYNSLEHE